MIFKKISQRVENFRIRIFVLDNPAFSITNSLTNENESGRLVPNFTICQ